MRNLRGNVSGYSGIAPPTCGTAARDFRLEALIRIKEVFVGAKCNHAYRQCNARVGSPQEAVVQCGESAALCSTAAGRPAAKGRVPEQVRHTTFVVCSPR